MPDQHKRQHDTYINNYLETGKKKIIGIGREVQGLRKDGRTFPFWLSVSELNLDDEKVFIGMVHDVTDLKKAEEEVLSLNNSLEIKVNERTEQLAEAVNRLLSANKQLEHEIRERRVAEEALQEKQAELVKALERERELNELKSRFVSIASHEFRTPLSTILSSAALTQRYAEKGNMAKHDYHLGKIKNAVNHLTGILNDFLNLTKLEAGAVSNNPEHFDFATFFREMIEDLSGLAKENQTIHCTVAESARVYMDKSVLKNIIYNLVSNAIKYSNKAVDCRAFIQENILHIEVQDAGIGIPEEEKQYMFTRFYRANNAGTVQGTGLGLNIVKRYVEVLGGSIFFESKEGIGTTFFVNIPLKNAKNT